MKKRIFQYSKLIRDNIPADMKASGAKVNYRVLPTPEYFEALKAKVKEEIAELKLNDPEAIKELADAQEALACLGAVMKITSSELDQAQREKNKSKGSFKKRLYIESVEVLPSDPYIAHYENNPQEYPEITD